MPGRTGRAWPGGGRNRRTAWGRYTEGRSWASSRWAVALVPPVGDGTRSPAGDGTRSPAGLSLWSKRVRTNELWRPHEWGRGTQRSACATAEFDAFGGFVRAVGIFLRIGTASTIG